MAPSNIMNICDSCGWEESNGNPHRRKCPECGAAFFERNVYRRFLRQVNGGDG